MKFGLENPKNPKRNETKIFSTRYSDVDFWKTNLENIKIMFVEKAKGRLQTGGKYLQNTQILKYLHMKCIINTK